MRKFLHGAGVWLMLVVVLPLQADATRLLVPVGSVIGLQLRSDMLTVAAYDDVFGETARNAGLKIGDQIIEVDGKPVSCAEDVRSALNSGQADVEITVRRGGRLSCLRLIPCRTETGPRIGVYLRQGISGIGTVTFYDPSTGLFGTLGHGVSDASGSLLKMTGGNAWEAGVISVKKGKPGDPGQLKGAAEGTEVFGVLQKNTPQGVFGTTRQGWEGTAIPTALYADVKTGPAKVRCQVDGDGIREYSVEIVKIYPETRTDGRNFLIRITDPELLTTTGGIVQGMGVIDNMDNTQKPVNTGFPQLP